MHIFGIICFLLFLLQLVASLTGSIWAILLRPAITNGHTMGRGGSLRDNLELYLHVVKI